MFNPLFHKTMPSTQQLSFSFDDVACAVINSTPDKFCRPVQQAVAVPVAPQDYSKVNIYTMSFQRFISQFGFDSVCIRYRKWPINENKLLYSLQACNKSIDFVEEDGGWKATLISVDKGMNIWTCIITIKRGKSTPYDGQYINSYSISIWKQVNTIRFSTDYNFIQSQEELISILRQNKPFVDEWRNKVKADVRSCLLAPYLETLHKAGYVFTEQFLNYRAGRSECDALAKLCKDGTKPKEIFKTEKPVYTTLKSCRNMQVWDCYRKLFKFNRINADTIKQAFDMNLDTKSMEQIGSILGTEYDGKAVFTWQSLMQYLGRLDTFEAICTREALPLLYDYLDMCRILQMKPRTDGDSLKREHDIAARNVRNRRDEIMAEKMKSGCEKMKKFDYSENIYMVRAIRDYNDLLDEANQQHNCVASYGGRIAAGSSFIYVMREVAHPDNSLITIELSPDGRTLRQKFLAYNQPIRNRSQSEFIDRWMKHIREVA